MNDVRIQKKGVERHSGRAKEYQVNAAGGEKKNPEIRFAKARWLRRLDIFE
jgi:hypothetical protein